MGKVIREKKVAFVVASNVIGGHEFQSRALADDFARHTDVSVYLNREDQRQLFAGAEVRVILREGLFLDSGWLGMQALNGLSRMRSIRPLFEGYDHVVVCAGTVEAGVCTSIALVGKNVSLYLPFFYDRTALWGRRACLYNLLLGGFGIFYRNIITINRIQAALIRGFMHRATIVIPNRVNDVPKAEKRGRGRLLCIGRLDRQKRIPELLNWLDFADNPYHEILVIGDGPERDLVARAANGLQYIKATVLGWKSAAEQNALIDGNDVLVVNSLIEGEPLVIREAMARRIPVIARDIVGVRGITPKKSRYRTKAELRSILAADVDTPVANKNSHEYRTKLVDVAINRFQIS